MQYIALLRGINVGGKNRIKMAELKQCFEDLGFENVVTYIQSGNVLFESEKSSKSLEKQIEKTLPQKFSLDSQLIKAMVFSEKKFRTMVSKAPKDFGTEPEKYYYDFIFLKDISSQQAAKEFDPRPEVDALWTGPGVIYHRRLGAQRTKSRLSKISSKPVYQNMTIRSWTTTSTLLALLDQDK